MYIAEKGRFFLCMKCVTGRIKWSRDMDEDEHSVSKWEFWYSVQNSSISRGICPATFHSQESKRLDSLQLYLNQTRLWRHLERMRGKEKESRGRTKKCFFLATSSADLVIYYSVRKAGVVQQLSSPQWMWFQAAPMSKLALQCLASQELALRSDGQFKKGGGDVRPNWPWPWVPVTHITLPFRSTEFFILIKMCLNVLNLNCAFHDA